MLYCLRHLCAATGASRVLEDEALFLASELNARRVLRCSISFTVEEKESGELSQWL